MLRADDDDHNDDDDDDYMVILQKLSEALTQQLSSSQSHSLTLSSVDVFVLDVAVTVDAAKRMSP